MKNIMTILVTIIVSFMIVSCGQNSTKQKELELKEKELALKEKELALKEKGITGTDTLVPQSTPVTNKPNSNSPASNKVVSEPNFPDIKSFFSMFKQAVKENDMEELYKYYDRTSSWTKKRFIEEYSFSNRVKKIILNTSLPEYWEGNACYGISGNDGEEGEAMFFSIQFIKSKNGNWKWDMSYAD